MPLFENNGMVIINIAAHLHASDEKFDSTYIISHLKNGFTEIESYD